MSKKTMMILAAATFFVVMAAEVSAQDVVMNSAETINKGNLKLGVFPTVLFSRDDGDSVWGVAGRLGYGFTSRFDIEAKAAFFSGLRYFGVDAELWLVRGGNLYVSGALGGHLTDSQGGADSSGIDATLLISTSPVRNLEFFGGFKAAFDSIENADRNVTRMHIVPGIEYRISNDLDFLVEVGIALNDDSRSYASVGLALYLLR